LNFYCLKYSNIKMIKSNILLILVIINVFSIQFNSCNEAGCSSADDGHNIEEDELNYDVIIQLIYKPNKNQQFSLYNSNI
jgi:ABC-type cobalt transport system substrate-binding protein